MAVRLSAMLACLGAAPAFADWKLERDVEPPSYAVIEPESSNLNIDSVVLACEEAGDARVLQLQIYLSTEGPLLPKGATPKQLKADPRAEIAIDSHVFSVDLLFADTYAVLADESRGFRHCRRACLTPWRRAASWSCASISSPSVPANPPPSMARR
jgi:hypothetical protein